MAEVQNQTPGEEVREEFKPYVPAKTNLLEFTFKAVFIGIIFSVILGAANAYLGLKVGMTVAATFPAAVIAMAILRIFKGSILEENITRTTAAVGEALVAGAIFTIPAFIISGVWDTLKYGQSTLLMLVGGILGVLFVIFLRRVLIEDATLPFPESLACGEIVKAGQKGEMGAKYVFGAAGLAAAIKLFMDSHGIQLFRENWGGFISFAKSKILLLTGSSGIGAEAGYGGGLFLRTPNASPAMLGVGYIIGPRLSAIVFSGGVFAWLLLVPLLLFIKGDLVQFIGSTASTGESIDWTMMSHAVWNSYVRPLAVGAMLVGAFFTLFNMRKSLSTGIARVVRDMKKISKEGEVENRLEKDLPYGATLISILILVIPIAIIYYFFCGSIGGAILAAIVMTIAGFLFAAVAGYLVGTIGSSNNPISGLTLSTLIVAALLMVIVGIKGHPGIAAVLGVAAVVCCSSGVAGDIIQDLKVGHIIGGTPWKMEVACMIGVVAAALVMVLPIQALHIANLDTGGLGGMELPAPQAGLMAMLSKGIVGGEMAWPLVFVGMAFSLGLILIKSPSPMLIAVGMYLPIQTTFAIFIGGLIKYFANKIMERHNPNKEAKERFENAGILLSSGFIAGEALMGILLAFFVLAQDFFNIGALPLISDNPWGGLCVFAIITYVLIKLPLGSLNRSKNA